MEDYRNKYHKYKNKYIIAKNLKGGKSDEEIILEEKSRKLNSLIKNKDKIKEKILKLQQELSTENINDILFTLNKKKILLENLYNKCKDEYINDSQLNILNNLIKVFNLLANKPIDWIQSTQCNGSSLIFTDIQNKKIMFNNAKTGPNFESQKTQLIQDIKDFIKQKKSEEYVGELYPTLYELNKLINESEDIELLSSDDIAINI